MLGVAPHEPRVRGIASIMSRGRPQGDYLADDRSRGRGLGAGHGSSPGAGYGAASAASLAGDDEDYEWIRYLGEGRSGSPAGQGRAAAGRSGSQAGIVDDYAQPLYPAEPAPPVAGRADTRTGQDSRSSVTAGREPWPGFESGPARGPVPGPELGRGRGPTPSMEFGRDREPWPGYESGRGRGPTPSTEFGRDREPWPGFESGPAREPGSARESKSIREPGRGRPGTTEVRGDTRMSAREDSRLSRVIPPAAVLGAPLTGQDVPGLDIDATGTFGQIWSADEAARRSGSAGTGRSGAVGASDVATRRGGTPDIKRSSAATPRGVSARSGKSTRSGRARSGGKPRSISGNVRTTRPRAGGRTSAIARIPRRIQVLSALAIVAVLAVVGYLLLIPRVTHLVSVPASLNGYVRQPAQASATAQELKSRILTRAGGAVSKVVAATYEQRAGSGVGSGPQIIVFIGGNSSSSGDFISGITELRGSFTTSAGSLGGQAACAPSTDGGPAECAWADGDTFGVLVSATLNATGLASELRLMRPLVEHVS